MPRQLIPAFDVLYDLLGVDPAAGGSILTYERGTTTPKATYADFEQSVPNENPVPLDSAGRIETPMWGDGEYTLVLKDAEGETVKTFEARPEQVASESLPALSPGFLTNDGSSTSWSDPLTPLDPTGQTGRILSTDGANFFWIPLPEAPEPPEPEWDVGTAYFKMGDYFAQWGTGSAAATGTDRTTATISFPVTFDTAPHFVGIQVTSDNITGHSLVAIAVTGLTTTGCTVTFDNADRHYQGSSKIVNPVPFQWKAEGKRADAP